MEVLELFAGAGGASVGMRDAGHVDVLGVDSERMAPVGDIRRALGFVSLTGEIDPEDLGRRFRGVGLLWGSPPCQSFSMAQTYAPKCSISPSGNGWFPTLDTVDRVRPRWCVFENVIGARPFLEAKVLPPLAGWYRHVELRVLNAKDHGVPQTRRRLFVVAGPRPMRWPATSAGGTLGGALPWLADADDPRNRGHVYHLHGRGGSEPERLDLPAPTVTTMEEKGTRASASSGWTFEGGPDRASDAAFLAVGRRRLTWQECAVLQGFDDAAREAMQRAGVSIHTLYVGIGNAVPPPLAEALTRGLR